MVPGNLEGLIGWVRSLPLASRGAESEIRLGTWMGVEAVFKLRIPKAYMHPRLDHSLRMARTRREAKLLARAHSLGAKVPLLLGVFPSAGLIVMERIRGKVLRDHITSGEYKGDEFKMAGEVLGKLHSGWISHGDPTTSNYIVSRGGVYLIDFGLADKATSIEDLAVDIHLFRRAVESTHAPLAREILDHFLEGYLAATGSLGNRVVERAEEIRLRGRYVEERRRTVWGG